jgi:uncharacterized protein YodC (DUF2158 family)
VNESLTPLERETLARPIVVGGCVVLKSGGPVMTVRFVEADDVEVEWFDKGRVCNHVFKRDSLFGSDPERLPVLIIRSLEENRL